MNKTITISAIILMGLMLCIGCSTTPVTLASSITPLEGKVVIQNDGRVEGRNSAFSVLGLFMIGSPNIDEAISGALAAKGGDTLVNVRCYEVYRYFLLFSTNTVVVQGDSVKLGDAAAAPKGGKR